MIRDFKCKETEKLFFRQFSKKLPQSIHQAARRKLEILEAAENLEDLRNPPSNQLEKLTRDRKRQYSIRINDQWRLCFKWNQGEASAVEIVDYH